MMFLSLGIVLGILLGYASPHGYLKDPPQRSSMWRAGFNVPANYDDNGLNCGGRGVQIRLGGKCGICGDPYDASVKDNEAGGKYALGVIGRSYESGEIIDAKVSITANHLGYFEFRLCPHNDPTTEVTQDCLDRHLLTVGTDGEKKFYIGSERKVYDVPVQLPVGITCSQCVMQWTYTAGNSWGCDAPGNCAMGKGPQETFVNCADINITGNGNQSLTDSPPSEEFSSTLIGVPETTPTNIDPTTPTDIATPTSVNSPTTGTKPPPSDYDDCRGAGLWAEDEGMANWCRVNCELGFCPNSTCDCSPTDKKSEFADCRGAGLWAGQEYMADWCKMSCALGYCPESTCNCSPEDPTRRTCTATGLWSRVPFLSDWCDKNCNHVPPFCPSSHCACSD